MMREQWKQFLPTEIETAMPPIVTHQQTPVRPQSSESDVIVPFQQAIRTGLLLALWPVVIFLGMLTPWPFLLALGAGLVWMVIIVVWIVLLFANRPLLWQQQHMVQPSNEKPVKRPDPPPIEVEITERNEAGLLVRMKNLEVIPGDVLRSVPEEGLRQFMEAGLNGDTLTEADWTPQNRGKPFSLPKFRKLMHGLEANGLAERVGEGANAARRLTLAGRAVFRSLLQD